MKILVTGGLGFIGSNFCRYLLKSNSSYNVTNFDKVGIGANKKNLKDLKNEKRYTFVRGDIRKSKNLIQLVKSNDVIVNFAAETHVDRSIRNPEAFLQNNTVGTFTLLETIRKNNPQVRLVQVSTDEIYGEAIYNSFKEDDPVRPSNPYSASKIAADMFVVAYHRTFNLNVIITRCTNNYGPYQFPEKLIPKTIIRAINNLPVILYGSGTDIRDWLYVKDHCVAIEKAFKKGKSGEIYNISSENELTNIELVKKILSLLKVSEELITHVEDRPGHDRRYSLDSSKIRSEVGWTPQYSLDQKLRETVEWYVNNLWWWKPLATQEILHPTPWKLRETK